MERDTFTYTASYCEENTYKLIERLARQGIAGLNAVFVSNASQSIPLWHQRAGQADGYVVWDYHVFVVQDGQPDVLAYDLDTTLGFPVTLAVYASRALRPEENCQRLYRIVPGQEFLERFASDRHHMMLPGDDWVAPPPAYAPIVAKDGCVDNLDSYRLLTPSLIGKEAAPFGIVLNEKAFLARFGVS